MALVLKDRVLESCTSPGTGVVTLLGAATGYQTFSFAIGNGNTTYYVIADQSNGPNWEVGIGTYSSTGNTLTRTTVLASSAGGSTVNFNTGNQNVWCDYPSAKSVYADASNAVTLPGTLTVPGVIQSTVGGIKFPDSTTQTTAATASIPSGAVTNFFNAAAPTGWTQVTTYGDYAMRIVSGTGAGTGGSVAFSTAFASQTPTGSVSVSTASGSIGSTAITAAQMPSHNHGIYDPGHSHGVNDPSHNHGVADPGHAHSTPYTFMVTNYANVSWVGGAAMQGVGFNTNGSGTGIGIYGNYTGISIQGNGTGIGTYNAGSDNGHSHSLSMNGQSGSFTGNAINLAVKYLDNILCTKN